MKRSSRPRIHSIKAAIVRANAGGRSFRIEDVELDGPRDDEVLVRIVAAGICHTDIDFYEAEYSLGEPLVLGHEGAGVIEEVGAAVTKVKPGDHVVLSYQSCGQCEECLHRHPWRCERFFEANFDGKRLDGSNALHRSRVSGHFFGQSSFATYALATERNLVKVAGDLPLEMLAPLGCGLQTGAGTVMNSMRVRAGSSIAVFGTGSVGLAAVMAARAVNARTIIAVDTKPKRLEVAMELGATLAFDSRRRKVSAEIRAAVRDGLDYAVDTTGDDAILDEAVGSLAPRGKIALIANPGINLRGLQPGQSALHIIQGDAVPQVFIPKLIRMHRNGQFPFDRLLKFYDFADINRAVRDSQRGKVIKPVLRMSPP